MKPKSSDSSATVANLHVAIEKFSNDAGGRLASDVVTVEEPLEMRLSYTVGGERVEQSVSVTMRTPGNDEELAVGFLAGEAIIRRLSDVRLVEHYGPPSPDKGIHNIIRVALADGIGVDAGGLLRHFYTTSSCGVCGKASLDAVRVQIEPRPPSTFRIAAAALRRLPDALREHQSEFARTGGLHATASFDASGRIHRVREDVGRHNALDKLAGSYFLGSICNAGHTGAEPAEGSPAHRAGRIEGHPARGPEEPSIGGDVELAIGGRILADSRLANYGVLLSGRASFELVQKAAVAGVPFVAAIGPPSSLAVELARDQNISLVGFLKQDRFNIYAGAERVLGDNSL